MRTNQTGLNKPSKNRAITAVTNEVDIPNMMLKALIDMHPDISAGFRPYMSAKRPHGTELKNRPAIIPDAMKPDKAKFQVNN